MLVPQLRSLQQRRTVWMWMSKRPLTLCACPHVYRERLAVQPAMKGRHTHRTVGEAERNEASEGIEASEGKNNCQ